MERRERAGMRELRCIAGFVLVGVTLSVRASGASVDPPPPAPSLSVSVASEGERDFLSATARNTPLHTLLAEIAARAGFQLTESLPAERTVSLICRKSPLDVALKQILQDEGANFMFVYQSRQSRRLQRIVLLPTDDKGRAHPRGQPSFGTQPPQEAACVRLPAEGFDEKNDPPRSTEIAADDSPTFGADTPIDQILALTTSDNVQMRTAALEALGALHPTDERARRKIIEGMQDPDAYVRSLSVGMLSVNWTQWPGAEDLMMAALQDAEPGVRRHALQVLWEKARPRIDEVLNIALQDDDPEIRRQAGEFLQEASMPVTFEP